MIRFAVIRRSSPLPFQSIQPAQTAVSRHGTSELLPDFPLVHVDTRCRPDTVFIVTGWLTSACACGRGSNVVVIAIRTRRGPAIRLGVDASTQVKAGRDDVTRAIINQSRQDSQEDSGRPASRYPAGRPSLPHSQV